MDLPLDDMEDDPIFPFAKLRLTILRLCALHERQNPGEYFTVDELAEAISDEAQRVKRCCLDLLRDGFLTAAVRREKAKIAISETGMNLLAEYESRHS